MTGKEQINTLLCRKAFQKDMLERIGIDLDEEKHNVLVEVIESAFHRTDERNAEIIQKRYKLDHQEKMILQWLLEEDMEPKVCEAIRVILEMDV